MLNDLTKSSNCLVRKFKARTVWPNSMEWTWLPTSLDPWWRNGKHWLRLTLMSKQLMDTFYECFALASPKNNNRVLRSIVMLNPNRCVNSNMFHINYQSTTKKSIKKNGDAGLIRLVKLCKIWKPTGCFIANCSFYCRFVRKFVPITYQANPFGFWRLIMIYQIAKPFTRYYTFIWNQLWWNALIHSPSALKVEDL